MQKKTQSTLTISKAPFPLHLPLCTLLPPFFYLCNVCGFNLCFFFFFYCRRALFAFSAPDPACVIYLYPHPVSYSLLELLTPRSFPTLFSLVIFILLFDWHPSLCSVFEKQYRSQASVNINRWLIKSNHLLLNANFESHQNLEND